MCVVSQVKEDALKQLKRLQSHIKELQREADDALQSRDDMANTLKDNEKRLKSLEADLAQLQEDLNASERARKSLMSERDELQDELNGMPHRLVSQSATRLRAHTLRFWVRSVRILTANMISKHSFVNVNMDSFVIFVFAS